MMHVLLVTSIHFIEAVAKQAVPYIRLFNIIDFLSEIVKQERSRGLESLPLDYI